MARITETSRLGQGSFLRKQSRCLEMNVLNKSRVKNGSNLQDFLESSVMILL
jgi:hypothetical protein